MDLRSDILTACLDRVDGDVEPATPLQVRTIARQAENAALFRALRDTAEEIVETWRGRQLLRLTNACVAACVAQTT
jgi:hypothetical protein